MGSEEIDKEAQEGAPVKKEPAAKPPKPPPKSNAEKSDVESGLDDRAARLLKAKKAIETEASSTSSRFGNVSSRRGTSARKVVMDQSEAPSDWKFVSNEKVYEAEDTKSMGRTVVFAIVAGVGLLLLAWLVTQYAVPMYAEYLHVKLSGVQPGEANAVSNTPSKIEHSDTELETLMMESKEPDEKEEEELLFDEDFTGEPEPEDDDKSSPDDPVDESREQEGQASEEGTADASESPPDTSEPSEQPEASEQEEPAPEGGAVPDEAGASETAFDSSEPSTPFQALDEKAAEVASSSPEDAEGAIQDTRMQAKALIDAEMARISSSQDPPTEPAAAEPEPSFDEPTARAAPAAKVKEAVATRINAECDPKELLFSRGKMTVSQEVVDFTLEKIRSAKVKHDPYQHVYIPTIFAPTFYRCMLSYLPAENNKTTGMHRLSGGNGKRFTVQISNDKPYRLGPSPEAAAAVGLSRAFWEAFSRAFSTPEVAHAWLLKFQATVAPRMTTARAVAPWDPKFNTGGRGSKKYATNYFMQMDLTRDVNGYEVRPHTDSPNKLVTTLYYLPKDNQLAATGTLVLRSDKNRVARSSSGRVKWERGGFAVVTRAKFVPNAALAFGPCDASWHAVKRMTAANAVRDSIQGFIHSSVKMRKAKCPDPAKAEKVGAKSPPKSIFSG
mmetsp:Transcript_18879/g.41362  ORF Transcript_18879/g.41362 Transcript_18879/m.41362 type:complete len:670 (-) Transcript_18879:293-2302(-)|eukprot:CAMPEP_0118926196 /NCGR_PEP_ID=MMETSP1169-20130426/3948_1 /TAXON_ID=36882 /ORGANISM="Pyramimonas obovata, Strain CCMP722" /LENGTH=669 /DNA_ID=CAMNT_0006867699 /DNA_START=50 /DNA_END=2059 /DNA_ORIENTATION=-